MGLGVVLDETVVGDETLFFGPVVLLLAFSKLGHGYFEYVAEWYFYHDRREEATEQAQH